MKFGRSLLKLAIFMQIAGADADDTDRYTLPPSKVFIEPCQREALLQHPGMIEKLRMQHRHGDFWMEYEIQARDGAEWIVLCDLASGSIIREQKLADDAY
jgi:hypothetical protein